MIGEWWIVRMLIPSFVGIHVRENIPCVFAPLNSGLSTTG